MRSHITIGVVTLSLFYFSKSGASAQDAMESWTEKCEIKSSAGDLNSARTFAPKAKLIKKDGYFWAPEIDGKQGVLIVHPNLKSRAPAEVKIDLRGVTLDRSKFLQITARGSKVEPGVLMTISSGGKDLKATQFDREWKTISIPLKGLPQTPAEITLNIAPIEWKSEYCYIDSISFEDEGIVGDPEEAAPVTAPVYGKLTARIVATKGGTKKVKFTAKTNCPAYIRIFNTTPNHKTIDVPVPADTEISKEVWVFNNYSSHLYSKTGAQLDKESARSKSGLDEVD